MSDQSASTRRPPGNPSWQRGGASPNPSGRPRSSFALSDMIRRKLDPEVIIRLARRLAEDETVPLKDRLDGLLKVAAYGFARPPAQLEVAAAVFASPSRFSELSTGELRAEIDRTRSALGLPPAEPALPEPLDLPDADLDEVPQAVGSVDRGPPSETCESPTSCPPTESDRGR